MAGDPGAEYSIRHHGLPLRATAIAEARPAVRIGEARPDLGDEWAVGAAPLVLRWAEWNHPSTFELDSGSDRYSAILRLRPPSYEIVAVYHDSNVAAFLYPVQAAQVGDLIDSDALEPAIQSDGSDANLEEEYWAVGECFLPLYLTGNAHEWRVCGFGRVFIERVPDSPDFPHHEDGDVYMRVIKLSNDLAPGQPYIAPRNASAVFDGTQPSDVFASIESKSWDDLIDALYQTESPVGGGQYVFESRVYAPAHAR